MSLYFSAGDSVLDIGGNVGYFAFKAAEKRCMAVSIDNSLPAYLIANYVREKAGLQNAHFLLSSVTSENLKALPKFDHVLLLSVFHHWSKNYGFEIATEMLSQLSQKAEKTVFFETGQEEMSALYQVPSMGEDVQQWLLDFLHTTTGRPVVCLGSSEVFVNRGEDRAERYLYAIGR